MNSKDTELILYRSEDGTIKIDVRMEDETVWLSQAQMVELFQTTKQNISLHINNCFKEGELEPEAVVNLNSRQNYNYAGSSTSSFSIIKR